LKDLTGISGKLPEPKFFGLIALKSSSPSPQFYLIYNIYIFAENSAERSLYAAYDYRQREFVKKPTHQK